MLRQKIFLIVSILLLFSLTACGAPRPPKMDITGWKPVNTGSAAPVVLVDDLHPNVPLHNPNK